MTMQELIQLYELTKDFCNEYSVMTDNYSLATGDNKFEKIGSEMEKMINERQMFFTFKTKLSQELKKRVIKKFTE